MKSKYIFLFFLLIKINAIPNFEEFYLKRSKIFEDYLTKNINGLISNDQKNKDLYIKYKNDYINISGDVLSTNGIKEKNIEKYLDLLVEFFREEYRNIAKNTILNVIDKKNENNWKGIGFLYINKDEDTLEYCKIFIAYSEEKYYVKKFTINTKLFFKNNELFIIDKDIIGDDSVFTIQTGGAKIPNDFDTDKIKLIRLMLKEMELIKLKSKINI